MDFYLTAFNELRYDRPIGMAVGPIPWSSIARWAEIHRLDADDLEVLTSHLRGMEQEIYEIEQKSQEKKKGAR